MNLQKTADPDPWSYRPVGSRAGNNRYVVVMEDKTWDQSTSRQAYKLDRFYVMGYYKNLERRILWQQ